MFLERFCQRSSGNKSRLFVAALICITVCTYFKTMGPLYICSSSSRLQKDPGTSGKSAGGEAGAAAGAALCGFDSSHWQHGQLPRP
jgi:hypothetical protein